RSVESASSVGCGGRVQRVALFGDEDEDDAIDDPQDLLEELLLVELAVANSIGEGLVVGVRKKSVSERFDSPFDAAAQTVEGAGALLGCLLRPQLEHAVGRALARETRGVAQE
ncbi:MAG: hypothetical protein ACK55I_01565, partial [bacterium]